MLDRTGKRIIIDERAPVENGDGMKVEGNNIKTVAQLMSAKNLDIQQPSIKVEGTYYKEQVETLSIFENHKTEHSLKLEIPHHQ